MYLVLIVKTKILVISVSILNLLALNSCMTRSSTSSISNSTQSSSTAYPETTMTVVITTISQRHDFYENDTGKSTEMAVGDTLQITVNSPYFQSLNSYSTDDNVIKQTGREGEVLTPPGKGVNWVFDFEAIAEGTSSINIGISPEAVASTYHVVVVKTFLTPTRPKYNVTFKESSPAGVMWSVTLGGQQSQYTEASSITFIGVPDGYYDYDARSYSVDEGGVVGVNGADQEVIVLLHGP